jgi:hypothetical protein
MMHKTGSTLDVLDQSAFLLPSPRLSFGRDHAEKNEMLAASAEENCVGMDTLCFQFRFRLPHTQSVAKS